MRKRFVALAVLAAALSAFILLPGGRALSQQIVEVAVNNFPETQKIAGSIAVPVPIPHSAMFRQLEVVVSPAPREETTGLLELEEPLNAAGFTSVVLSLQGTVKGSLGKPGRVGAVLLPDEKAVERAFNEEGLIQLQLEVNAALERSEIATFSAQQQLPIGFPRYKIYFYNSTDKSVELNLYAYLTH